MEKEVRSRRTKCKMKGKGQRWRERRKGGLIEGIDDMNKM